MMEDKKYKILENKYTYWNDRKIYRIRALKSFGDVKEGQLGGYVEKESNLSHSGDCWIYKRSKVYGNAILKDNASVTDNVEVSGSAIICDNAKISKDVKICGNAKVYDYSIITENAIVRDNATIQDRAKICGNAVICDNVTIRHDVEISGNAMICDNVAVNRRSKIYDNAKISDNVLISYDAEVFDNAKVSGNTKIFDKAKISGNAVVDGDNITLYDNIKINGDSKVTGNLTMYGDAEIRDNAKVNGDKYLDLSGGTIICGDAVIESIKDYITFKNSWSSGRYFTWTRSNDMWIVGWFYGNKDELIKKMYDYYHDSMPGDIYKKHVELVEEIKKRLEVEDLEDLKKIGGRNL